MCLGELRPAAVPPGTSVISFMPPFWFYLYVFEVTYYTADQTQLVVAVVFFFFFCPDRLMSSLTCGILPRIAATCGSQRARVLPNTPNNATEASVSANGQIYASLTLNLECRENSWDLDGPLSLGDKGRDQEKSREYYE